MIVSLSDNSNKSFDNEEYEENSLASIICFKFLIKFCFLNSIISFAHGKDAFLIFVLIVLSIENNFLKSELEAKLMAIQFFQALPVLQIL
jgi:hypothetical protein